MNIVLMAMVEKMQSSQRGNLLIKDSPLDLQLVKSVAIHFNNNFPDISDSDRHEIFSRLYGKQIKSTKELTVAECLAYLRMADVEHSNRYLLSVIDDIVRDVVMDKIQRVFKQIKQEEFYLRIETPVSCSEDTNWSIEVIFAMSGAILFRIEDKSYAKCVKAAEEFIKDKLNEVEEDKDNYRLYDSNETL